jgi:hypothetical protein
MTPVRERRILSEEKMMAPVREKIMAPVKEKLTALEC